MFDLKKGDIVRNTLPIMGEKISYNVSSSFLIINISCDSILNETNFELLSSSNEIICIHIPNEDISEFGWKEEILVKV